MNELKTNFEQIKEMVEGEVTKKKTRLEEVARFIDDVLPKLKEQVEAEYSDMGLALYFEPVIYGNSPAIKIQISNDQNSLAFYILLDSAIFLVGYKLTGFQQSIFGGEMARDAAEVRLLINKRIKEYTQGW